MTVSDARITKPCEPPMDSLPNNLRVWQEQLQSGDQRHPMWLEQREASQRLKKLLKLLETRMEVERPERLEQPVHVDELGDLVQLMRVAVRVWGSDEALGLLTRLEQLVQLCHIPTASGPAYETDFAAWAQHQALMVHLGQWENLDREHVREELEALSRSEHNELESRLEVLTTHLLKWRFDSASEEPRRGWQLTIREQCHRILRLLKRSPSLRPLLPTVLSENYPYACMMAIDATDLPESTLPATYPWPVGQCSLTISGQR